MLQPGRGLPGCGVFVYSLGQEEDGSLRGVQFFSLAFLPIVPLGRVRLVADSREGEIGTSGFVAQPEGPVPLRLTLRLWLIALALFAVALAPGAYVLPRVHETGVLPGLRLVLATLAPLLVLSLADLKLMRLVRQPRQK